MLDLRAGALATADFPVFSLPPRRPSRSGRRTDGGAGRGISRLIHTIRRELASAGEPATGSIPRLSNYPY